MGTGNDIKQSGISQRFENKHYRNEHFYYWKIINNRVLELILIVLNEGTLILEESFIAVLSIMLNIHSVWCCVLLVQKIIT